MLEKNAIIKVSNRDSGTVGYTIPELGVRRKFQKGEIKEITMEELRKLSYLPGGQTILNDCLIVHSPEALKELIPDYEPEYFYTEKEIKELLLRGSQAQFLDCLDFAPTGVIELIKQLATELEINDIAKREAIFEKTGFNVNKAIEINRDSKIEDAEVDVKKRRTVTPVVSVQEPAVAGRRTSAPKYTINK